MPRTAQPGTTNSLRRLAGRRTNVVGGPHLPLHSSEEPPVLFRLPDISPAVQMNHESTPAPAISTPTSTPLPNPSEPAFASPAVVNSVKQDLEEGGQNVFNHVAGAVTGAVAGTVANGVAIAGNALSASTLGSVTNVKASFASASTSLNSPVGHSPAGHVDSYPIAKPTPHHRSSAEAAETETRSWWEHWSSGIILMLLILALVTAGIMAIRDPKRTLNTNRSIADDAKENVSATDSSETTSSSRSTTDTANKPTLAEKVDATDPPSSASLSPALLPNPITAVDSEDNRQPALSPTRIFTLNQNDSGSASDADNSATPPNSQSFVSSSKASPSSPASNTPFPAGDSLGTSTPTIPASTPINNSSSVNQFRNDQAGTKLPAVPNNNGPTSYDLTWPVEDAEETREPIQQNTQSANSSTETNPASPTLKLSEADRSLPSSNMEDGNVASTPMNGMTDSSSAASKAPYLETSLPNEDLENILAMRRNAISSGRLVSNQYFAPNGAAEANTAMPYQQTMPNAVATMPTINSQIIPSATNPAPYYPVTTNQAPPQATNLPTTNNVPPGYAPQYAAPSAPATNWQMNSQNVGARSFTYQPNGAPLNNGTQPPNSTLQLSNNFSGAVAPGNYQLDPRMAQQLGYAPQPAATQPAAAAPPSTTPGWWNTAPATNRPATTTKPNYSAPNIIAPSMQPNTMQPNTMQPNTMQPNTMQPNTMQPNTMQPNMMQPNMMQPNIVPQTQSSTLGGYSTPGSAPTTQQPYYIPNTAQPTGVPTGFPQ